MDNLAHTLVGAALGRVIGAGRVPRAALLGAVAANAPDWAEFLVGFRGRRADYYSMHRGITHSFVGAAVEIVAITLLVGLAGEWWARRRGVGRPRWGWITLAVGATVLSHLFMDWQGSYGLRPLLPWSGQWYYGDWVAIVDPFYWLIPLLALAWGAPRHWLPALLYLALATPMVVLLVGDIARVAPWVTATLVIGLIVGGVGWVRHWIGVVSCRPAAGVALLLLAGYSVANAVASHLAKQSIRQAAVARFGPAATFAALTVVGQPFTWEPVYASADSVAGDGWALARHLTDPHVSDALRTPSGRAMSSFARFLVAEVDRAGTDPGREVRGVTVFLRDARYNHTTRVGWGVVAIRLAGRGG